MARYERVIRLAAAAVCIIAAVFVAISAGLPPRSGVILLPGQTPVAAEIGALAPPIEAVDVRNQRFSLQQLRGGPVVINFWATWCVPCVNEMPRLQRAAETFRDVGLHIVGVNVNEPVATVSAWQATLSLTYPLLIDRDGRLAYSYRVRNLPHTLFIGRDGRVRQIIAGELSEATLQREIEALFE